MKQTKSIDIVLHFNKQEALGRIPLEAVDFGVPSFCFNEGGIWEVENLLGMDDFTIDGNIPDWSKHLFEKISKADVLWTEEKFIYAERVLKTEFSPDRYTSAIEKLFNQL